MKSLNFKDFKNPCSGQLIIMFEGREARHKMGCFDTGWVSRDTWWGRGASAKPSITFALNSSIKWSATKMDKIWNQNLLHLHLVNHAVSNTFYPLSWKRWCLIRVGTLVSFLNDLMVGWHGKGLSAHTTLTLGHFHFHFSKSNNKSS